MSKVNQIRTVMGIQAPRESGVLAVGIRRVFMPDHIKGNFRVLVTAHLGW